MLVLFKLSSRQCLNANAETVVLHICIVLQQTEHICIVLCHAPSTESGQVMDELKRMNG